MTPLITLKRLTATQVIAPAHLLYRLHPFQLIVAMYTQNIFYQFTQLGKVPHSSWYGEVLVYTLTTMDYLPTCSCTRISRQISFKS